MIKLNGLVYINDDEYFFEDFTIEVDEDLGLPFDLFEDDEEDCCDGDCEYCNDCDDDEEDEYNRQANFNDNLDELLDDYTTLFMESCICPECVRTKLLEFLNEFVDI